MKTTTTPGVIPKRQILIEPELPARGAEERPVW